MKMTKKVLSILLSFMLVLGALTVGLCVPAGAANVGDIIEFGEYPQTKVSETAELKNAADVASWIDYDYYAGNGDTSNGLMAPGDYMKFADLTVNGLRYRAVRFTEYRPYFTGYSTSENNSHQDENGYSANTTYYFRYDPLKWRVLDPSDGLVMCESIVDSQPYQNFIKWGGHDTYYTGTSSIYANNYYESSIRFWLNNDFYYTAFSSAQMSNIKNTEINNDAFLGYTQYSAQSTDDPVFLLSYTEAKNNSYGLSNETERKTKGSDYAKCQGLNVAQDGYSYWWLRTAGDNSDKACYVYNAGALGTDYFVYSTIIGIRPACYLKDLTSETHYTVTVSSSPSNGGTVTGGGTYISGAYASLSATPASGWHFVAWYLNGELSSSQQSFYRPVVSNLNYVARFEKDNPDNPGFSNFAIKNYSSTLPVDYKSTVIFHTTMEAPDNYEIVWSNGATGSECKLSNVTNKEYKVSAEMVNKTTGETEAVTEEVTVTVNTGFFAKIIAFFRNLFGSLPTYEDFKKK